MRGRNRTIAWNVFAESCAFSKTLRHTLCDETMKRPDSKIVFAYAIGLAWILIISAVVTFMNPGRCRVATPITPLDDIKSVLGTAVMLPFFLVFILQRASLILTSLVLLWGFVISVPVFSGYTWARQIAYKVLWIVIGLTVGMAVVGCLFQPPGGADF